MEESQKREEVASNKKVLTIFSFFKKTYSGITWFFMLTFFVLVFSSYGARHFYQIGDALQKMLQSHGLGITALPLYFMAFVFIFSYSRSLMKQTMHSIEIDITSENFEKIIAAVTVDADQGNTNKQLIAKVVRFIIQKYSEVFFVVMLSILVLNFLKHESTWLASMSFAVLYSVSTYESKLDIGDYSILLLVFLCTVFLTSISLIVFPIIYLFSFLYRILSKRRKFMDTIFMSYFMALIILLFRFRLLL